MSDKPKMAFPSHAEGEALWKERENLAVPSLVRVRSGQGIAYMCDADELRRWRATHTSGAVNV